MTPRGSEDKPPRDDQTRAASRQGGRPKRKGAQSHPPWGAALLMIGVVVLLVLISMVEVL